MNQIILFYLEYEQDKIYFSSEKKEEKKTFIIMIIHFI